jgi:putative ABC transport system permease protein
MNIHDFRVGWRHLIRQPAYSAVVIFSLSIGFAVCFLLLGYVRFSFRYDSDIPGREYTYQVMGKLNTVPNPQWYDGVAYPLIDIAQHSEQVEMETAVSPKSFPLKVDHHVIDVDTLIVQPSFEQMFAPHVLEGDLHQTLSSRDHLALTVGTAMKLFGRRDVVGKTAQINGQPFLVGAVVANPAANSTLPYSALLGFDSPLWDQQHQLLKTYWSGTAIKIYLKLKPDASATAMAQVLQDAIDHSPVLSLMKPEEVKQLGQQKWQDMRLGPLSDVYFDENGKASLQANSPRGDRKTALGLATVALMILLLAVTNYVNLATVRTLARQREIAVRKVLGATIPKLIAHFLAESALAALLATLIGLLMAWEMQPLFSSLVGGRPDALFTPVSIACSLLFGVIVGVLAGIYPAWVALQVHPQQTLAGRGGSETLGGLWLRRVLSVLQFSTAMCLVGITLAIAWQTQYASKANPGFDPTSLLVLELPDLMTNPACSSLRDALARLPGVTGVVTTADPIGRNFGDGGTSDLIKIDGKRAGVVWRPVSPNFFEVLALHPVAGRLFDSRIDRENSDIKDANVIVINRAAALALGYASPEEAVGQTVTSNTYTVEEPRMETMTIIGVAPDFRYQGMHETPIPMVYSTFVMTSVLTIKASGDLAAVKSTVDSLAQQYLPNNVLEARSEASYLAENYEEDLRMTKLLGFASMIALLISAFGIYVLSAYNLQRLSKQIVLRKLHGAKHRHIASLVGREFIVLIAVAGLVGLPVAAVAIQRYLSTFAEHAPIAGWTLLASLLLALLVTLVSTASHAALAMRMTPARLFNR